MIATLGGLGLIVTGWTINAAGFIYPVMVGAASTIAGIPLWASGSDRKYVAEIKLQKDIVNPECSWFWV